jgi:hypothetical protein
MQMAELGRSTSELAALSIQLVQRSETEDDTDQGPRDRPGPRMDETSEERESRGDGCNLASQA